MDSLFHAETNIQNENSNLVFILISPWKNGINYINIDLSDGSYNYLRKSSDTIVNAQGIVRKKQMKKVLNYCKNRYGNKNSSQNSEDGPESKFFIIKRGEIKYESYALGDFNDVYEEKMCRVIMNLVKVR